ncbi:MAG: hypothetical protein KY467_13045 [Gemmatimonadetes bacterium]|nr:hypothetical protein [Gemmatimonadota bacterium]
MAADSTRRPRDDPFPPGDGKPKPDGDAASDGGETLAEKIRRYRQRGPASGGAPGPASHVVRHPREE